MSGNRFDQRPADDYLCQLRCTYPRCGWYGTGDQAGWDDECDEWTCPECGSGVDYLRQENPYEYPDDRKDVMPTYVTAQQLVELFPNGNVSGVSTHAIRALRPVRQWVAATEPRDDYIELFVDDGRGRYSVRVVGPAYRNLLLI
jgi:hypothetical protein